MQRRGHRDTDILGEEDYGQEWHAAEWREMESITKAANNFQQLILELILTELALWWRRVNWAGHMRTLFAWGYGLPIAIDAMCG
ncbi:hypothetical protein NDU88_001555 [Pleurodeles waltl]|uniref:Uncharacterized protein n=1 Tax=Pleurodeles waltl TaxID=8319 RepID=A0AAV7UT32_PLEWA|nr:hypothetical protein NDU88_001555 [Pleurodeles waltl]